MHLLAAPSGGLDDGSEPVDLRQSPADIVVLSAADTEIAGLARARAELGEACPGLRLANLLQLGHALSVDLYLERTLSAAKLVVLRLIGGAGYWRYGTDETVRLARGQGIKLAVLSGTQVYDPELSALSTLGDAECRRLFAYLVEGGPDNFGNALRFAAHLIGQGPLPPGPEALPRAGVLLRPPHSSSSGLTRGPMLPAAQAGGDERADAAERACSQETERGGEPSPGDPRPVAALVFYRALLQSSDLAPVDALCAALEAEGLRPLPLWVTSLKDPEAAAYAERVLGDARPSVVLNATAFALSGPDFAGTPLDRTGAPVLQVAFAGAREAAWRESARGLSPADIAMHVALPEVDGRVFTRAVSFKGESLYDASVETAVVSHRPLADRVAFVAALAAAWTRLRRKLPAERRIALVLSSPTGRDGRLAGALGLDAPASAVEVMRALRGAGYAVADLPEGGEALLARLLCGPTAERAAGRQIRETLPLAAYEKALDSLPQALAADCGTLRDSAIRDSFYRADRSAFAIPALRFGNLAVMIQPPRGGAEEASAEHDPALAPPPGYVAAYAWLREVFRADAVVHMGSHGSLEWLPGKALALSQACWPEALLGPTPLVYPFIVSNPGEGAQAKRRAAAVLIGHLTPPLRRAEPAGALRDLDALADEYAEASALDARRLPLLAKAIFETAEALGLDRELGLGPDVAPDEKLRRLDAFLCDVKDLPVRDGLHVFGRSPAGGALDAMLETLPASADPYGLRAALEASGPREMAALLAALDGRFVAPGPSGAPTRGRLEVLPTGRNLYSVDPRALPTAAAWELGRRTAEEVVTAYLQEHGRYPERIALTAWGSSAMRTGGDDIAQALALIGARPVWEGGRVTGFEIATLGELRRPRVDIVVRASGFFRDAFPAGMDLIASAVRAVAAREEPADANPVRAHALSEAAALGQEGLEPEAAFRLACRRVFSSAPGRYGTGLSDLVETGRWSSRADLAEAFLAASAYSYGAGDVGAPSGPALEALLGRTQALVQAQDAREFDLLDTGEHFAFEGGLAAAVADLSGAAPAAYHADTCEPGRVRVRALGEEIARAVRARAADPRWIEGARRHGHAGAAELAATVTALFGFAATTGLVPPSLFAALHAAYLEDEETRGFLAEKNPAALREIAARFAEAIDRGLWQPRRNSLRGDLDDAMARAA